MLTTSRMHLRHPQVARYSIFLSTGSTDIPLNGAIDDRSCVSRKRRARHMLVCGQTAITRGRANRVGIAMGIPGYIRDPTHGYYPKRVRFGYGSGQPARPVANRPKCKKKDPTAVSQPIPVRFLCIYMCWKALVM